MSRIDLVVPDMGNAHDVDVVDVLVKPGDVVEIDSPLVTLETDKASMDVPSSSAGKVAEVLLKRGDKVSAGSIIARVETSAQADAKSDGDAPQAGASSASTAPATSSAVANTEATFAESFDADELERTVTQPILKAGAMPPPLSAPAPGHLLRVLLRPLRYHPLQLPLRVLKLLAIRCACLSLT